MNTNNEDFFSYKPSYLLGFFQTVDPSPLKRLTMLFQLRLEAKDRSKLRKIQRQANFRDFFLKCKNCQMTGKPRD